jgi:toxin ParE1/3/4
MAEFVLTNKAVEDLTKIWIYICEVWCETQADKYYLLLLDYWLEIAENSFLRKNYDEISYNLLGFRASRHIIFYKKLKANQIKIVRILHTRMDYKSRIQGLNIHKRII